jgi:hypothetical protein
VEHFMAGGVEGRERPWRAAVRLPSGENSAALPPLLSGSSIASGRSSRRRNTRRAPCCTPIIKIARRSGEIAIGAPSPGRGRLLDRDRAAREALHEVLTLHELERGRQRAVRFLQAQEDLDHLRRRDKIPRPPPLSSRPLATPA